MIDYSAMLAALGQVAHFAPWLILGVTLGVVVGAIPGFSASNTLIVLLPLSLVLDVHAALTFMAAVYAGANTGGSIPAILVNTPGTGGAVATCFDGHAMAKKGLAQEAIVVAAIASIFGGSIGAFIALFASPSLAAVAMKFTSVEMFVVVMFGIVLIAQITGESIVKGLLAGCFGLLMGAMGFDHMWSVPRATFGLLEFYDGMPRIPVLVGLFAISSALLMLEKQQIAETSRNEMKGNLAGIVSGALMALKNWIHFIISAAIGLIVGVIPGAGATIGGFVSYQMSQNISSHPEKFGKGEPAGVIASEAANNSVTGGAMVPLLSLGLPGSETTLIMLMVLQAHALPIGPNLFKTAPVVGYTVIIALLLAHLSLAIVALPMAYSLAKVTYIPSRILAPIILALTMTGAFAERAYFFDMWLALGFGFLGYVMRKTGYPPHAIVLGVILGPMAEGYFLRALRIGGGSLDIFFSHPLGNVLWGLLVVVAIGPHLYRWARERLAAGARP